LLIAFDKFSIQGAIHAPMPSSRHFNLNLLTIEKLLFQQSYELTSRPYILNQKGNVTSTLIGGNLSLLADCLSTKLELDTNNKILFIEEIAENMYKIDRWIQLLKRAGKFNNLKGLIIGSCTNCPNDGYFPSGDYDFNKVISQAISDVNKNYPIAYNVEVGHENSNNALQIGRKVNFNVDDNGMKLKFI
jgi:muramoyltetrapeptide carboxypeptidase